MDTLSFLKTILPDRGVYYIMRIVPRPNHPKGDVSIHHVAGDLDDMAEQLLTLDRTGEQNVYYAMASYKEAKYKTVQTQRGDDFTYIVGRKQDNVAWVKSLWMDWDVGKDNPNSYATQKDALDAMKAYVKATGLPSPIVVNSGYGLHSYWVFTEAVDATQWMSIAKNQRVIMNHLGVKFDPARDKDSASVLRAPGCHNKKAGKEPQVVKVLKGDTTPMPAGEFLRIFKKYVADNNLTAQVAPDTPSWAMGAGNLEAWNKAEHPESFVDVAIQHCKQMQEFRDTGGKDEPTWYAHLGLLKHFVGGEQIAHQFSRNHPGYDEDNTQTKMDQWQYGPTSCEKFKSVNPTACAGCTQTCRSPIQLGHNEVPQTVNLIEVVTAPPPEVAMEPRKPELPKAIASTVGEDGIPFGWPPGYGFDLNNIYQKVKDPNGVWQDVRIASPLLYPIDQILDEEGTLVLRMHIWIRGAIREFNLPAKYTADARSLKMQLHANGAHVIDDKAMANYISKYKMEIQSRREEIRTYTQMGWKHDFTGFLIGDKMITKDGESNVVMAKTFPADLCGINRPTGSIAGWVNAVDTLYNRQYGEPYQFAICAAFAAPLHELLDFSEWRGIPYAITTDESGFGKTTVNMIANSIWCDPEKSKIADSTPKATLGIASAFNNIPFLLDEVTQYLKDPADMASILYAMSNGRPRRGMEGSGRLRETTPPWIGCCSMTGNRNILLQLSENKLLPEATQMRVFEIDLDSYPRLTTMTKGHPDYIKHNAEHNAITKSVVSQHHSIIGPEYVRHIMEHLPEVRAMLAKTAKTFTKQVDGDATKERFYYHLISCVLVGAYYAKQLGFINFSINNLRDWCVAHVNRLRGSVSETRQTPEDRFAKMLADLQGNILVTKNYAGLDARRGNSQMHLGGPLRNPVCGRFIIGDEKERTQLYITTTAVQQWCTENGESYAGLVRDFMRERLIRLGHKDANPKTGAVRIGLGKGVVGCSTLANPWCLELDANKALGIAHFYDDATVTQINSRMKSDKQQPQLPDVGDVALDL